MFKSKPNNSYTIYHNYEYQDWCTQLSATYFPESKAKPITTSFDTKTVAKVGSKITLKNIATNKTLSFVLSTWSNNAKNVFSIYSPIGQAVLGQRPAGIFTVKTPSGLNNYRVLSIAN